MTLRSQNTTGLLFGTKACSRRPPEPELVAVVRGKFCLRPGEPLRLCRDRRITDDLIASAREANDEAGQELADTAVLLGQGSLQGERYRDDDAERVGELVYPGDFADTKLGAEVMVRACCYAPAGAVEQQVAIGVGDWRKTLKVIGPRVRTDTIAGGAATEPQVIGKMAVDYAHAYGGPGFANNPVGKGHLEPMDEPADRDDDEAIYQPPRSERSAAMIARQLPNVVYPDGAETQRGLAAGFGPLSPSWPLRTEKRGKKYDEQWLHTRAPYWSEDFDWTYHHAGPPDQQLEGYLRGDETFWLEHLHPEVSRLSVALPGLRVRVFVLDDQGDAREVPMVLDTLFADVEDEALYLTWRGHTRAREDDLSDISFALVVTEPLGEAPQPTEPYLAELRAFADDPVGLKEALPAGFEQFAENAEKLEEASDAELEAMVDEAMAQPDRDPFTHLAKKIFGPLAPPQLSAAAPQLAQLAKRAEPAALKRALRAGLRGEGRGVGGGLLLQPGAKPQMAVGRFVRQLEQKLHEMRGHTPAAGQDQIDAGLNQIQTSPALREMDPSYQAWSPDEPGPDEPGPGANLAGQDLSRRDLRGLDLSGANLEGAILSRTDLASANLTGAQLRGAQLYKTVLDGAELSDADLSVATLQRVSACGTFFSGCKLDMTRLSKCNCAGARFERAVGLLTTFDACQLEDVVARGLALRMASIDRCTLDRAHLAETELDNVRFMDCQGEALVLDRAQLGGTSFEDCRLPQLSVQHASGKGVIFLRCQLPRAKAAFADHPASHFLETDATGADFRCANLEDGRFDRAILRRASFAGAKLSGASLRKAVISGVRFTDASLYDAKLVQTAGEGCDFSGANLERALFHRSEVERP